MTAHAPRHHATATARDARFRDRGLLGFLTDRFLWLPLGAGIALVWVNLAPESYFSMAHRLAFPVNEIGMALFLGLIVQETLEAAMPGGALHTWRRWSIPVVAAAGGILGAAFVYLGYVFLSHEAVLAQAWPVACAVDIAAGFYVLRLVFRRHGAASFLLVIGIVTNAVGLIVLAGWPAFTPDHLGGGLLITGAVALAAMMRRSGVRAFWPYIGLCGTVSWFGFYSAGMHPALALVPVVPFLPREERSLDLFADPADDDAVHHAEHEWNLIVHLALFLFGLVNAGVVVRGYDTGTWAVLAAALIGRPVGILLATGAAVAAGLHLPRQVGWRELIVISLATSSGFTFALFAATSLLPLGAVLTQVKVGALLTALGALTTYVAARVLHVGRFAPRHVTGASDHGHAPRTRRRGATLSHPGVLPG